MRQQQYAKQKQRRSVRRSLAWIDLAETVDIVRENPHMKRESVYALSRMIPTGELTIELRLTGIKGIEVRLKKSGSQHNSDDWFAV